MNKHVDEFLSLRCAPDVLAATSKSGKTAKEISEAMGLYKRFRNKLISKPMTFDVVEFCAGNALPSLLAVFIGAARFANPVDRKQRKGRWSRVHRLNYMEGNIYDEEWESLDSSALIVANHACGKLANRAIEIFNKSNASSLYLMPCCQGRRDEQRYNWLKPQIGQYRIWCLTLSNLIQGAKVKMHEDENILSPCNVIIEAHKI